MSNFDDFDNDTPPQGGPEDDHDAELVMQAERQAEEDQMLAELAREEDEDREAEQRRLDDQRRDDDQRAADDRRDGIQADIDRQQDFARAEEERIARQAELDAGMEFSMGPEKEKAKTEAAEATGTDDREAFMRGVRERHMEEMKAHAAQVAEQEAAEKEAHPAFYKGGFVDLKGNTVSAQDVNAIMANHRASGGHQAAQERFGLATGKGSELAAAHYAAQKSTAVDEAGQRQNALHRAPGNRLTENEEAMMREVDRFNQPDGAGQLPTVVQHEERDMDWAAYMGMSEAETKAVTDRLRAEQIRAKSEAGDRFLQQGGASPEESVQGPLTESESATLHQVDRFNGPDADAPLENEGEDWGARLRESEAQQELQAQRERQAQSQGMELSR